MFDLSTPMLVILIIAVIALIAGIVLLVVASKRRNRRRDELSSRFGSEYERTVDRAANRRDAEEDLYDRSRRHAEIRLQPLSNAQTDGFRARFEDLQASFVDAPASAVRAADGIVTEAAVARGYPDGPTSRVLSDVSVDHPEEVAAHRRGQEQLDADAKHGPSTEDLRAALLAARQLFEALVGQAVVDLSGPEGDARTEASVTQPVGSSDRGEGETAPPPPPPGNAPEVEPAPTAATSPPRGDGRRPIV